MSGLASWIDANPGYAMIAALALPLAILDAAVFGTLMAWGLRRRPVTAVVAATLAAIFLPMAAVSAAYPAAAGVDDSSCRLVSSPDLSNADIGDLSQRDSWRTGFGNSTSPQMRRSVATVLDAMAAENPAAVLVAGDLVEGHWGADVDSTRFFGRVHTLEQRRAAIRRAGAFYYGEWAERYAARGLTLLPAVGDHEVGDNPWSGTQNEYGAGNDFKRSAFGVYKQTWARAFTQTPDGPRYAERPVGTSHAGTAYAVEPCPGVLVVTVDVFRRGGGDVHASLGAGQLTWLDDVLTASTAETVIVQGHTPVVGPVRNEYSSALMYEGGTSSAFWQTLVEHDVDLYLSGEVHTVTALQDSGVTQISHGGLIHRGRVNYLTMDIGASIDMEIHRFDATVDTGPDAPLLWATTDKRPFADVVYQPGTHVTGTMSLDGTGVAVAAGELALP